jgi:hypothetical protein
MSESAGLEGADDQYNLRSNFTMLKLAKPRTNALKRNFSYHGAKTWNNLPTELKNLTISERVNYKISFAKINYKISFAKIIHF